MNANLLLAAAEPSVGQTLAGLLGLGMFAMLGASFLLWGRVVRWGPRSIGVDLSVRPATVPWGLADLLMFLVLFGVTVAVSQAFVLRWHDVKPPIELARLSQAALIDFIWANSAGTIVGTAVAAGLVLLRHGRLARRLGCSLDYWQEDIKLGVIAFLLLVPPILLVQLALTQFFPSQHPLIEAVRRNPEPRFLWASGFAAVVVAPLVEELQFRVLLQGWFQNLAARSVAPRTLILGGDPSPLESGAAADPSFAPDIVTVASPVDSGPTDSGAANSGAAHSGAANMDGAASFPVDVSSGRGAANAYRLEVSAGGGNRWADRPTATDGTLAPDETCLPTDTPNASVPKRAAWWPVFLSAGLFAAAHMSHGPDPIPLFLLSAGLGLLYRQTGRVWPSVVVHFLLNLWTLVAMTVSMMFT